MDRWIDTLKEGKVLQFAHVCKWKFTGLQFTLFNQPTNQQAHLRFHREITLPIRSVQLSSGAYSGFFREVNYYI